METTKALQNAKVFHLKGVSKSMLHSKGEIRIVASYDQVINIDSNNQGISLNMQHINTVIKLTTFEANVNKEPINLFIPSPRDLIQAIQILLEATN